MYLLPAARTYYCLEILPLLNSSESLDLIEELRDTADDDVALSVRCVAATISTFIITPQSKLRDMSWRPPRWSLIGNA